MWQVKISYKTHTQYNIWLWLTYQQWRHISLSEAVYRLNIFHFLNLWVCSCALHFPSEETGRTLCSLASPLHHKAYIAGLHEIIHGDSSPESSQPLHYKKKKHSRELERLNSRLDFLLSFTLHPMSTTLDVSVLWKSHMRFAPSGRFPTSWATARGCFSLGMLGFLRCGGKQHLQKMWCLCVNLCRKYRLFPHEQRKLLIF